MVEKFSLIYCFLLNILLVRGQTYTSIIKTESGPIRGIISTTIENVNYAAFKGIPYGKPPINNLRFKPPLEVDSWTDVYNATTDGSVCIQHDTTTNSSVGSEDCLYINVYTPHTIFNESISKPVMVWIHGGGFTVGSSRQRPDFILGQDVVYVSFNYRLTALGFLNLDHESATGNCGLKDQNLALKWVKKNIAKFGGDPEKITIFGQSAGSISVDFHVLSDMSAGLFRQSISMSGSPLCIPWSYQNTVEAVKKGFILGSKLGVNTSSKDELLKALQNASAADIVAAARDIDLFPFRPTLENPNIATDQEKFLTECSLTKYVNGNYTKGPHMMGFTAKESVGAIKILGELFTMTQSILETVENASSIMPVLSEITDEITTGKSDLTGIVTDELIKETTDLFYILGIDTKQRYISRNNSHPIYYYRFSFIPENDTSSTGFEGAGHASDLLYIFYMPTSRHPLNQTDYATTRQRMVKLWTNFVKFGNPTPDGDNDKVLGITWPDSRNNGDFLDIDKDLTTGPRPTNNFVRILQLYGLGSSPVLNDCVK